MSTLCGLSIGKFTCAQQVLLLSQHLLSGPILAWQELYPWFAKFSRLYHLKSWLTTTVGAVDSGAEMASFAWFLTATTFWELTSSLCLSSQWNSFSLFTTDLCSPTTSSCQASLLPFLIAASVPSWSSSNLMPSVEELENWGPLAWEWENSSVLRSRSRAGWGVPMRRRRCWTLARSQCPTASSSVALRCSLGESLACQLSWRKRVVSSKWKGQVSSEDPLLSSNWLVSKYMSANKGCIPRTLKVSFSHLSKIHWKGYTTSFNINT